MRTIQMTLDDDLVNGIEQQERKHRRGYEQHPVAADEFSIWETEQAWGDE